jgi:cytochrome c biogenesis protein CcmG, thiol:disulfide interchange protein DsbE
MRPNPERTFGPARKAALAIAILLVAFIAVLATRKGSNNDNIRNELLGKPVPEFSGPSLLNGEPFDLAKQTNKFVVINFFATWCAPCVKEHPQLVAFSKSHPEVGLVSVVWDTPDEDVKTFFAARGGDWPVLTDRRIPVDLGVRSVPETYIVDPDGTLFFQTNGGITKLALEEAIRRRSNP